MSKHIILAHGILGVGNAPWLPADYFKGVAAHLIELGHTVTAPQVDPIGDIEERGRKLAKATELELSKHDKVHIIAHSMGGLDARYALANNPKLASGVATLVTIGTPHRGSPVADAVANNITDPLFSHIPGLLRDWLQSNAGALNDLTTANGIHFDETTPDVEGVRYIEVAGDASKGGQELIFFNLASVISRLNDGEINDGMVTRSSALRNGHEHFDDWPVDHAGEIGWNFDVFNPLHSSSEHLERYKTIVDRL